MKIAITYADGQVAPLSDCKQFLVVTVEGKTPVGREILAAPAGGTTTLMPFFAQHECEVLICGELSIVARNVLEMLGIVLVPGVTGDAEQAAVKFLAGEKQGDPSVLERCREEDPDDPMKCLHDCSKCAGCGPIKVPPEARKRIPEV